MVAMVQHAAALTSQTDRATSRDASRARTDDRTAKLGVSLHGASRGILALAIETDVIPRLLARRQAVVAVRSVTAEQVAHLTDLTLQDSELAVSAFICEMQDQGVQVDTLYLELLTASARRLGEFWVNDVCDFTQVTTGLWRLQHAMRALGPAFLAAARADGRPTGRALLVPLPGEQHTFGLSMVFDFFRRAGWSVWSGLIANRGELTTMVRAEPVDVLGFSLACDERIDEVRAEIRAVRQASCNPGIAVMVGGPPFLANPALVAAVGADGTAVDGLQAVAAAGALLRSAAGRG